MISTEPKAHSASSLKKARLILVGVAAVTALFGLAVLLGWLAHLPALVRLYPGFPRMQFNTAVCFVLSGIALGAWTRRRRRIVPQVLGATVALMGIATFSEYFLGADFGIDQLLFKSDLAEGEVYAGRMSAVSAFCFSLVGLALLQLSIRRGQRYPWFAATLASIVVSVAAIALLGHAFGLPGAYQWGQLSRIAPHTAAGFAILGCGLAIAACQSGCRPGERTPRWLPAPLAHGVVTGTLVLYFALASKETDGLTTTVQMGAASVEREVKVRLENRARTLSRMARRWEYNGAPAQAAWEHDASLYARDFPDLQAVEWIDPSGRVRWIVPHAGNEAKVGLDAAREALRAGAMELARQEHRAVFTRAITLFRGGRGVIVYSPIQREGGEFEGWIAGVFEMQGFLDRYLPADIAAGQALELSDNGLPFYQRFPETPAPARESWVAHGKIELPGATWDLRVWPTPTLTAHAISALPVLVLITGIGGALMLGGACALAQSHARASRAHATMAEALQLAMDELKTLEGLMPICSCCKRVRDDTGYWNQIDTYLHRHTDAKLSHGYCPECAVKAYEDFGMAVPDRLQAELEARNFE